VVRGWNADRLVSVGILLLVSLLVLLPLAFLLYGSLSTGAPGQKGSQFTLEHFRTVYLTPKYLTPLFNTLQLAAAVTILTTPVGTLLAWLMARTDLPGKRLFQILIIVPIFISPLLGALAWLAMAAPGSGFLNGFSAMLFGVSGDLFDIYSFWGIVFVMCLYYVPYSYLFMVGALTNLDPSLEDACRTIGGGMFTTLRRVTLPLVVPALVSSALLVFVLAAELFSVPAMLGVRSHIETIPLLLYMGYQHNLAPPGEIAALATLLLWITLAGIFFYRRMVAMSRRYVTISGKGSRHRLIELGRWRFVALALVWLYLLAAVVLPYLALLLGSFLKFLTGRPTPESLTLNNYLLLAQPAPALAVKNTLLLAVAGASITVALAFVVSFLTVRGKGRLVAAVDYIASLPVAVPGMAMAIGLLWAYTILPLPVYGTIFMLLIAYITRFIAYSVRVASGSLHQIDPELEEAGRVAGLSNLGTFWRISFPLLRPSVVSAWTLVFIFVVVEITATILLYTTETRTLSVVLWNGVEMSGSIGGFTIGVLQTTVVFFVLALTYRLVGSVRVGME
jgi:iron(III) transport system permease protein